MSGPAAEDKHDRRHRGGWSNNQLLNTSIVGLCSLASGFIGGAFGGHSVGLGPGPAPTVTATATATVTAQVTQLVTAPASAQPAAPSSRSATVTPSATSTPPTFSPLDLTALCTSPGATAASEMGCSENAGTVVIGGHTFPYEAQPAVFDPAEGRPALMTFSSPTSAIRPDDRVSRGLFR